jgi:pimeloyl-ACP methyl ester carboxylesterase
MRKYFVLSLALVTIGIALSIGQPKNESHVTYIIVHGAWGGCWDWRIVDSLLTSHGHHVVCPQLTGLGERVHLASTNIGLATHINDVVNTILWENMKDIILIGHSYGGMVITGVADKIPERIRKMIYLDAFLPESGESVKNLTGSGSVPNLMNNVRGGFIIPAWVKDTNAIPRDVPQPLCTFTDTLRLVNPLLRQLPAVYILTYEPDKLPDDFQKFADRAAARKWPVFQLRADHVPQRSDPIPLVELLERIR